MNLSSIIKYKSFMDDLTKEQIDITSSTYNSCAHEYALKVERKPEVVSAVEELILIPFYRMLALKNKSKIAFIGCGTGRDMNWFIRKGYECDGYDKSEGMLLEARNWVQDGNFYLLDISTEELPKNRYAGIYCESALAYVSYKNLEDTLINIKNSLVLGGVALLGFKVDGSKVYEDKTLSGVRYYIAVDMNEVSELVSRHFKINRKLVSKDSFERPTEWLDLFVEKV